MINYNQEVPQQFSERIGIVLGGPTITHGSISYVFFSDLRSSTSIL